MNIKQRIENYTRAAFPVLVVQTTEETKTIRLLHEIATSTNRSLETWSLTRGLINHTEKTNEPGMQSPLEFVVHAATGGETEGLFVLLDPQPFLHDNPELIRTIKDFLPNFKSGRTLILMGSQLAIPQDLQHLVTMLQIPLPEKGDLEQLVRDICEPNNVSCDNGTMEKTLTALSGLTTDAAADAVSLSIVESGALDPTVVMREKCSQLSEKRFLRVEHNIPSIEDVGGMDQLKNWLSLHKEMFSKGAREFHCPIPKGFLTIGPPGCGKSLVSMATASVLELPLVMLDIGNLMGGIVGDTERNTSEAIQIMEAMAPIVVRIEELDKQFGGSAGQDTSHEVTKRMMSKLLTWLQEKTAPVFVVATANRIELLASTFPELLRKGRWDEIWYVDLPNEEERREIFTIHLRKLHRDPNAFDLDGLVKKTTDFQGVEIEYVVNAAVKAAFGAGDPDVTTKHLEKAMRQTVPQSKLAKENIESLRKWADGRARPATGKTYQYFQEERTRKIKK